MNPSPEDLYTVEDFLKNNAFRTWLLERRLDDQLFWQNWLAQHPEKRELYEQAVATFLVIQGQRVDLSNQQVKEKTEEILNQLPDPFTVTRPIFSWYRAQWAAAAAVAGLLIWWQLGRPIYQSISAKTNPDSHLSRDEWKIVKNITGQALVVLLPDNSSVLLSTDSQLRFRKQTNHPLREVFLEGEAFFEVSKNPAKPFMVHTTNLTAKVLGTSFQVHSFNKEATAFVRVKTGKVTVIPVTSPGKTVSLVPNEKLSLEAEAHKEPIVKRESLPLAADPSAIIDQQFDFEYTPVSDIFSTLEGQYHMPIRYNRELLQNCTFTGKLNDVPFLEKIRLICLTIESTYEIIDNQVVIHSLGCS